MASGAHQRHVWLSLPRAHGRGSEGGRYVTDIQGSIFKQMFSLYSLSSRVWRLTAHGLIEDILDSYLYRVQRNLMKLSQATPEHARLMNVRGAFTAGTDPFVNKVY
jgi:hypothetical protein